MNDTRCMPFVRAIERVDAGTVAAQRHDGRAVRVDHDRGFVISLLAQAATVSLAASTARAVGMRCVVKVSADAAEPEMTTLTVANAKMCPIVTMRLLVLQIGSRPVRIRIANRTRPSLPPGFEHDELQRRRARCAEFFANDCATVATSFSGSAPP